MSDSIIDKDAYLAFDALTLKQHIKDMLNESGVFTDQNFEGSNISTITDIISYTFNVLMFYLNKTSTETMFSDAEIYENMNRIVKELDYKPIGKQTSTLSFIASADSTGGTPDETLYTIPRYTFFQLDGVPYSFNEDITFAKTVSGLEELTDLSREKLLYQGSFEEYPLYTAIGQENEIVHLTPGDNVSIDHFNIQIYIKPESTGVWEQWESTPSLYLENADAKKYEIRFNENKNYEITFGNGINAVKLNENDQVAIYYLKSLDSAGEVGVGVLAGSDLTRYETVQFNTIITDVVAGQYTLLTDFTSLLFDNDSVSSFVGSEESVDKIRENAPKIFRSQYRLVTPGDYEVYVETNFANLVNDVAVANNWTYLSEHLKYYHDLGIESPNDVSRILYNQVLFGDACNFNNVYLVVVPRITTNAKTEYSYLAPSQKELIISSMNSEKTLTSEIVLLDPVYIASTVSIPADGITTSLEDINNTELLIIKSANSRRDNTSIKNDISNIFKNYFSRENTKLGQIIDVKELTSDVLAVDGVKTFYTQRTDNPTVRFEGLSMLVWNPTYPTDKNTISGNLSLGYFKYPYLYDSNNFQTKLRVQAESRIYENVEY